MEKKEERATPEGVTFPLLCRHNGLISKNQLPVSLPSGQRRLDAAPGVVGGSEREKQHSETLWLTQAEGGEES